ncbi:hypothetical protein D3C71_1995460 [compost metagenome]
MSGGGGGQGIANQRGGSTVMAETGGASLRCFQGRHLPEQRFQSRVGRITDQPAALLPIALGQGVDHLGDGQMQDRQLPNPLNS